MFIAGAIASLAAAAVTAYATIQQGRAAEQAARYNQRVAQQQAEAARQRAESDAETLRRRHERTLASQRVRYGASGVLTEGAPLLVMMDSEEEAALDVARVRHGGAMDAYGLQAEAQLQRWQGSQARRRAMIGASGALLTGVSSAASTYARRPTTSATLNPPT